MASNLPLPMHASPLTTALDRYQTRLTALEQAPTPLAIAPILDTLYARDRLEPALAQTPYLSSDRLSHILALDQRLQHQAHRITQAINLPDCRAALPSPPSTWWPFWKPIVNQQSQPRSRSITC